MLYSHCIDLDYQVYQVINKGPMASKRSFWITSNLFLLNGG